MSDNTNSGSGSGGMGVIAGVLLAIVLIAGAVFAFNAGMFGGANSKKMDVNLNVNTPHMSTPSLPSAPSAPGVPTPK